MKAINLDVKQVWTEDEKALTMKWQNEGINAEEIAQRLNRVNGAVSVLSLIRKNLPRDLYQNYLDQTGQKDWLGTSRKAS